MCTIARHFNSFHTKIFCQDSVVCMATHNGLKVSGFEPRCAQYIFLFSTPVHTGAGAHPAFCTLDTRALHWGYNGRVVVLPTQPQGGDSE
jgi:hypothetical protein